jgi:hypothetical protein
LENREIANLPIELEKAKSFVSTQSTNLIGGGNKAEALEIKPKALL